MKPTNKFWSVGSSLLYNYTNMEAVCVLIGPYSWTMKASNSINIILTSTFELFVNFLNNLYKLIISRYPKSKPLWPSTKSPILSWETTYVTILLSRIFWIIFYILLADSVLTSVELDLFLNSWIKYNNFLFSCAYLCGGTLYRQ